MPRNAQSVACTSDHAATFTRLERANINLSALNSLLLENNDLRRRQYRILLWMSHFSQGLTDLHSVQRDLRRKVSKDGIAILFRAAFDASHNKRIRALIVLFHLYGIHPELIAGFLALFIRTVKKYIRLFKQGGVEMAVRNNDETKKKYADPNYKEAVFSILHAPPCEYGFNRTTWRRKDIHSVMARQGMLIGHNYIDKIIRNAGYRFRKARKVLTSNDPDYRSKLDRIKQILSHLGKDERFFSIDEFGPLAIKKHGGRRLVRYSEYPTIPQFQFSKGCLVVTAALELRTNQVTHFYGKKKNTEEMITLLHILIKEYKQCRKLWLSWDAAGWHASKRFEQELAQVNSRRYRQANGTPLVGVAPLPARAQFLNIIESVFSGLATSVVHNSDYASADDAKVAIDRYFAERNEHFQRNPKRAGDRIWKRERVPSHFREGQNCKNARFR